MISSPGDLRQWSVSAPCSSTSPRGVRTPGRPGLALVVLSVVEATPGMRFVRCRVARTSRRPPLALGCTGRRCERLAGRYLSDQLAGLVGPVAPAGIPDSARQHGTQPGTRRSMALARWVVDPGRERRGRSREICVGPSSHGDAPRARFAVGVFPHLVRIACNPRAVLAASSAALVVAAVVGAAGDPAVVDGKPADQRLARGDGCHELPPRFAWLVTAARSAQAFGERPACGNV